MTLTKLPAISFSKEFKKILTNTGWLFGDRLLRMGCGLLVLTLMAKYLGVARFGQYNFATAFVGLFSQLATMGLPSLVVKSLTHEPEQQNEILGTTFCLRLLGGISSLILSIVAIFLFRNHDPLIITLVAILASAGIFTAFDTIDAWYQSQFQSKYTVIAKNIAFLTLTIIKVILINVQAPLLAFALAETSEVITAMFGLVVIYKFLGYSPWRWRWDLSTAKNLLQQSWPLVLSGLSIVVYQKIDQVMLGEMIGDDAVGLYSVAATLSEAWYFIPSIVISSLFPSIANAKIISDDIYRKKLKITYSLMSVLGMSIATFFVFASNPLILNLFGTSFVKAGPILQIHIWAGIFVFLGGASSQWLVLESLTKYSAYRTFIGCICNILLNLILIPSFGGFGAAIATLISYCLATFSLVLFRQTRKCAFDMLLTLNPYYSTINLIDYFTSNKYPSEK